MNVACMCVCICIVHVNPPYRPVNSILPQGGRCRAVQSYRYNYFNLPVKGGCVVTGIVGVGVETTTEEEGAG